MRALPAAVASLFLSACFNSNDPPAEPPEVTAAITTVVLAGDCGGPTGGDGGGGDRSGDRYAHPGPGEDEAPGAPCPPDICVPCQQSFLFITFEAGEGNTAVDLSIDAVRMRDVATGAEVDALGAYLPQRFLEGGGIRPWDERIRPFDEVNASYQLTAPDWAGIGGGDEMATFGMTFRVEADVAVDGVPALTAQSADVSRLPPP
jgi:hypothetical protein